jgi:hypothetical protein
MAIESTSKIYMEKKKRTREILKLSGLLRVLER